MKINDIKIKKKKINEDLSNWVGDYGAATLRQAGNRLIGRPEGKLSVAQKMGQDTFIKDFIGAGYSALNQAIQGGLVDPTLTTNPGGTKPKPKPKPAPTPGTPPAPGTPAPPAPKPGPGTPPAPGTPAPPAPPAPKPGPTPGTPPAVKPPVVKPRIKGKVGKFAEEKYSKLNAIFENILLTEAESISQFLSRWLTQYMGSVRMSDPNTNALLTQIQSTYATDKGKAAFNKLASAAYAAGSAASPMGPAGRGAAGSAGAGPSALTTQPKLTFKQIKQVLASLKTKDLENIKAYVDKVVVQKQQKSATP